MKPPTHLRDVRRPTGATIGVTTSSQIPVICEVDIILGVNQGSANATTDLDAVTCRGCRRIIGEALA